MKSSMEQLAERLVGLHGSDCRVDQQADSLRSRMAAAFKLSHAKDARDKLNEAADDYEAQIEDLQNKLKSAYEENKSLKEKLSRFLLV